MKILQKVKKMIFNLWFIGMIILYIFQQSFIWWLVNKLDKLHKELEEINNYVCSNNNRKKQNKGSFK